MLQTYASGTDDRVLVGPGVGQDAAVISFGAQVLVAKTDPITFATDQIGWYAVHINANDIAAMGAVRSEEHTSELQSRTNLVCRLLLEKKKKKK
mgnify:CR=1 FL=1